MGTYVMPTSKGQITLRKGVLKHLGVRPGQRLELVHKLDGTVSIIPEAPKRSIRDLVGILGPSKVGPLTVEEINEGIERGAVEAYLRSVGELGEDEHLEK